MAYEQVAKAEDGSWRIKASSSGIYVAEVRLPEDVLVPAGVSQFRERVFDSFEAALVFAASSDVEKEALKDYLADLRFEVSFLVRQNEELRAALSTMRRVGHKDGLRQAISYIEMGHYQGTLLEQAAMERVCAGIKDLLRQMG